jgi:hypothetical protein
VAFLPTGLSKDLTSGWDCAIISHKEVVGMYSPIKLEIVMVEKIKRWEKDGKVGQIAQVYAKLINENPDFPLYFVLFAPSTVPITAGSVVSVPISGIRITLGEDAAQTMPFSLPLNDAKKPKI